MVLYIGNVGVFCRSLLLVLSVPIAWAAQAQSQPVPPPQAGAPAPNTYVGSNVCKTCHPDVWLNFYRNPHYKGIAQGTLTPEKTGCESCHGPGQAHVQAQGGKATIRAFSELPARGTLDACLSCHASQFPRSEIRRSSHTEADVSCTSCHSIHKAQTPKVLLAKKQTELCYGCHANIRAQFQMPSKHRVNEGVIACTDCHNPHGAASLTSRMGLRPRMVQAGASGEQPCLKCHTDKRGPFAYEHPPARVEGCETCHNPHGSMNARLLRRPAVFTLCLECHTGGGNYGRQGNGITLITGSHNLADPRYQNCTTCHLRIHGSNADSRFLR